MREEQDHLASSLDGLAHAGGVFATDDFVDRLIQAVRTQWDRLRELPADDGFWVGTNGRATWYKLDRFCELCLARDPSDETARWAAAAHAMSGGLLELSLFATQLTDRPEAVYEVIATAEWAWLRVGVDPTDELRGVLIGADRAAVERLAGQVPAAPATPAARAALRLLDGAPFAEAIGRARWDLFVTTLLTLREGVAPPGATTELVRRNGTVVEQARTALAADPAARAEAIDAAGWCRRYRHTDTTEALRELLGSASGGDSCASAERG